MKKRGQSPTSRSKQLLESEGWSVWIAERWNRFAGVRQDAFGFGDLLAIRDNECLLVQCTSTVNLAARVAKAKALPMFDLWNAGANRGTEFHGWAKRGPRGKRKLWECRRVKFPDPEWFLNHTVKESQFNHQPSHD